MNEEEVSHLKQAINIQIFSIDTQIEMLKRYKSQLEAFSSQVDNALKKS